MAGQVTREVGKDGRVLLTDNPRQRPAKPSNPSLDELDALLAATNYDTRRKQADAQRTHIAGEGPIPSLQPAFDTLKRTGSLQQLIDSADRQNTPYASDQPTQEEADLTAMSTPMGVMTHALDMAAIPGSILPSPLQPVAAGYQALRGVQQAVQDPSLVNVGVAGLMAAPAAASVARRLMPAAAARTGAGAKGPFSPWPGARPKPAAAAPATAGGNFKRMGLLPFDESAAPMAAVDSAIETSGGLPSSVKQTVKQEAERLERGIVDKMRGGSRMEPRGSSPNREELGPLPNLGERRGKIPSARPKPSTPIPSGAQSVYPPRVGGRSGDVHDFQTTGGMFGFDELPEISDAELRRLMRRF